MFKEICEAPSQDLALHWDSKLTKDCFCNKHEAQADASCDLLEGWNLKQHVKALVFDTTASNTGWNNSAAKCLGKLLDQKLFYNACHHHIYELIIGAVYTCLFGDSSAPDDANFKCF